eukprot:scpid66057/ scgid17905/ 
MPTCGLQMSLARAVVGLLCCAVVALLPECAGAQTSAGHSQIQCGSAIYMTGTTSDLASSRKACLNANSVLMTDLYLGTLSAQERGCVLSRSNPVWLLDSRGEGEVFDPRVGIEDFIQPKDGPYDFICLPSNYTKLMARLAPDVNTTREIQFCNSMKESYVCDGSGIIIRQKQLNLCLPRCSPQAPAVPSSRFVCSGFNVTLNMRSSPFSVANAECSTQKIRLLRYNDFAKLNMTSCFRDELAKLGEAGKSTFWLRYPGNADWQRGSYNLDTGSMSPVTSRTKSHADAFICAEDWNECKASTSCPPDFQCVNLKGTFMCNRDRCLTKDVDNGILNVTALSAVASAVCEEGYSPHGKASCQADGWVHNETLCVKNDESKGIGQKVEVIGWWKWSITGVGVVLVIGMIAALVMWRGKNRNSTTVRARIPTPQAPNEDSGGRIYDSPYIDSSCIGCDENLYNEIYQKNDNQPNNTNRYLGFSRNKPANTNDDWMKHANTAATLAVREGEFDLAFQSRMDAGDAGSFLGVNDDHSCQVSVSNWSLADVTDGGPQLDSKPESLSDNKSFDSPLQGGKSEASLPDCFI